MTTLKSNFLVLFFVLLASLTARAQTHTNLNNYLVQDYNPKQTEVITSSGLFIVAPEVKTFDDEQSEAAQNYFVAMDDWMYYSSQLIQWFAKRGIPGRYTSKRYLRIVGAQQEWIIDTQKDGNGHTIDALLYKTGQPPIKIELYENATHPDRLMDYMSGGKGGLVSDSNQVAIKRLSNRIRAHSFLYGFKSTNYDTLRIWNQRLTKALVHCGQQHPQFLELDNPFPKNNVLSTLTSADNKFRIICWNDGMSGTLQVWRAIAFWQTSSGIHTRVLYSDTIRKGIYGMAPEYWNIVDYELDDGQTVYLVRGVSHGSNRLKVSFVKAFAISPSGELNDQVQFFKTPSKTLNHISLMIDLASAPRDDYNPYIHLSKDGQTLYIPVADEEGKLTVGKHLIYQFNGRYFVFQGIE